jgi:hypothetical protein
MSNPTSKPAPTHTSEPAKFCEPTPIKPVTITTLLKRPW